MGNSGKKFDFVNLGSFQAVPFLDISSTPSSIQTYWDIPKRDRQAINRFILIDKLARMERWKEIFLDLEIRPK
jgi:hypothetical protein